MAVEIDQNGRTKAMIELSNNSTRRLIPSYWADEWFHFKIAGTSNKAIEWQYKKESKIEFVWKLN